MPVCHGQGHPRLGESGVELQASIGSVTCASLNSVGWHTSEIREELKRSSECSVRAGVPAVLRDRLAEVVGTTDDTLAATLYQIQSAKVKVVCFEVRCTRPPGLLRRRDFAVTHELWSERSNYGPGDVILNGEYVLAFALVCVAPQDEPI